MIYLIYNVSYELTGHGHANSIISASSPERIKSLLDNYLREEDSTTGELKGVPIKIRAIINTGYKTSKEGVIFNSESEELSIRAEEGFKSPLFLR